MSVTPRRHCDRGPGARRQRRFWSRGLLRQYRHDFDAARIDLARALELDPEDTDALAWCAPTC